MGVYDIINFKCPNCGEELNAQSKSGACSLANYDSNDVPFDVAIDANRHSPVECPKCKKLWYFNPPNIDRIKLDIIEYKGE